MLRTTPPPDTRIASPRLEMRPLAESDFDDLVAELSDFEVTRMLARVPYPYGRGDARAFHSGSRTATHDLPLMIAREGRVIGGIGLARIDRDCEFGYWLGRAHWGKGYATEASRAFLGSAFASFDIAEIHSGVFSDNAASLNVQVKLGFERTGIRQVDCLARGRRVEHIDTILTRRRFEETRP